MPHSLRQTQKIGKGMWVVMWVVLLVMATWWFGWREEQQHNPNQMVSSSEQQVYLQRNSYGHYVFNGQVNGNTVTFLVDTGATDVVIAGPTAQQLRLQRGQRQYVNTANGTVAVYRTHIDTLEIGGIIFHDIAAVINPAMTNDSLLGMNALRQVDFRQQGDMLILEHNDNTY